MYCTVLYYVNERKTRKIQHVTDELNVPEWCDAIIGVFGRYFGLRSVRGPLAEVENLP